MIGPVNPTGSRLNAGGTEPLPFLDMFVEHVPARSIAEMLFDHLSPIVDNDVKTMKPY